MIIDDDNVNNNVNNKDLLEDLSFRNTVVRKRDEVIFKKNLRKYNSYVKIIEKGIIDCISEGKDIFTYVYLLNNKDGSFDFLREVYIGHDFSVCEHKIYVNEVPVYVLVIAENAVVLSRNKESLLNSIKEEVSDFIKESCNQYNNTYSLELKK